MSSSLTPPPTPPLRQRDDLAAVLRDAMVSQVGSEMNEEAHLSASDIKALGEPLRDLRGRMDNARRFEASSE